MRSTKPKFARSRLRKWGWPLILAGIALGIVGFFVMVAQNNSYDGSRDGAVFGVFVAALGCGIGNAGFFILLFGILEDRVYEAQGMVQELTRAMLAAGE